MLTGNIAFPPWRTCYNSTLKGKINMETLMKDIYSACEHLSENWQDVERIFQGPETG